MLARRISRSIGFELGTLLAPFRKDYLKYLAGTVLRQELLMLVGYSIVWTLRLYTGHKTISLGGW